MLRTSSANGHALSPKVPTLAIHLVHSIMKETKRFSHRCKSVVMLTKVLSHDLITGFETCGVCVACNKCVCVDYYSCLFLKFARTQDPTNAHPSLTKGT